LQIEGHIEEQLLLENIRIMNMNIEKQKELISPNAILSSPTVNTIAVHSIQDLVQSK
jgi:hypothetical protein